MIKILFLYAPVVILLLGVLLGVARLWRAAVFMVVFLASINIFLVLAATDVIHADAFVVVPVIFALLLFSGWLAALAGLIGKPVTPSPAEKAVSAYQNLDEDQKKQVHAVARKAASIGIKHLAGYLRRKGHVSTAGILKDVGSVL